MQTLVGKPLWRISTPKGRNCAQIQMGMWVYLHDLSIRTNLWCLQIELEGRSYDDFIVPACPTCQLEGEIETNVRKI